MIPSKPAFWTLTLRPSALPIAWARSASMPWTVLPSLPKNSFGA